MKRILLSLVLGAAVACPSLVIAEDDTPPPPPPAGGPGEHGDHHMGAGLTDAEKAELKKAHEAAIAADPSLKTEGDALRASHVEGTPPTEEQKAKMKAFHEKMDAAMIKADPAVEPILKKIKEHHHHGGPGAGGPPPPPPSDT